MLWHIDKLPSGISSVDIKHFNWIRALLIFNPTAKDVDRLAKCTTSMPKPCFIHLWCRIPGISLKIEAVDKSEILSYWWAPWDKYKSVFEATEGGKLTIRCQLWLVEDSASSKLAILSGFDNLLVYLNNPCAVAFITVYQIYLEDLVICYLHWNPSFIISPHLWIPHQNFGVLQWRVL